MMHVDQTADSCTGVWREISIFILFAWGLALLCALIVAASNVDFRQLEQAPGWVWAPIMLLAWSPALAALLTRLICHRTLRGFNPGWRRPEPRYLAIGLALPIGYTIAISLGVWLSGVGQFDPQGFIAEATGLLGAGWASQQVIAALYALLLIGGGTLAFSLFALGEELGYNGFLIPRLMPTIGLPRTALLTGLVWAVCHYPQILLFKNYTLGTTPGYALVALTMVLVGLSFALAWLRVRSGSLWPAVLMHASHNVWIFLIAVPLTREGHTTSYVIGETSVGMVVVATLLVLFFTRLSASSINQPRTENQAPKSRNEHSRAR